MFKNFLKLSFRHFQRRKTQSIINFLGLAIGMGACIVLILYSRYELSFDQFHTKADRIFMVYKERHLPTGMQITRDTWVPMAEALQNQIPGIKNAARYYNGEGIIEYNNKKIEESITYTDPALFSMFTFPLQSGKASELFTDQQALFLSAEKAEKLFGNENPLGKTLRIDYENTYTVKGVIKDIPENSTLEMDIVIPLSSIPGYENYKNEWDGSFLYTYVELTAASKQEETEAKMPAFISAIWNEELNNTMKLKLEPLPELHNALTGANQYAYILIGVAFAILVIAALNFTNLKTASSMERVREIGLRKTIGSSRKQLFRQVLIESIIVSLAALVLAVILSETILPWINNMYQSDISLYQSNNIIILIALIPFALLVGLLSGVFPAYAISKLKPISALQGQMSKGMKGHSLRRFLVIFQFVISIALIAGTTLMWKQINHMKHADLNFHQENMLIIPIDINNFEDEQATVQKLDVFRQELQKNPQVKSMSSSSHVPGNWPGWFVFVYPEEWKKSDRLRWRRCIVDANYLEEYDIEVVNGRNFNQELETDAANSIVINKAALEQLGWNDPIGKSLNFGGDRTFQIIGITEDYHYQSLVNQVEPLIHFYRPSANGVHNYLTVNIAGQNISQTVNYIKEKWKNLDLSGNFPYYFLDQQFQEQYQAEERFANLTGIFTLLSILIASMGLFAISAIIINKKTKEVAIRKAFGSSSILVVLRFLKFFTIWILIANAIAWPGIYWFMKRWLQDFAYRIEIGMGVFVLTLAISLFIALITVFYQSIKAANTNPADALRYE